jgi:peroxiredoxin
MNHSEESRRSTRAAWVISVAAVVSALFVSTSGAEAFRNVEMGAKAPSFTLKSVDGSEVSYAAPTDKPVVIAFIRQGQDKSEKLVKDLSRIAPEVVAKSILLAVVVNPGEGDPKSLAASAPGVTVLLDEGEKVYASFGVMVAPQTAVLAPDGSLKAEVSGYTSSFKSDVEITLRQILGMEVDAAELKGVDVNIPEARRKAMRDLQKAEMLIKRKMKSKAIPQVKEAIAADPTYAQAHVVLGELIVDEGGSLDEAEASFKKAQELEATNLMAKVGMARIRAKKGDYEGAAADLEKAAMVSPKAEKLYYYLGVMHEDAKQFEKAAKAYRKGFEKMMEGGGE